MNLLPSKKQFDKWNLPNKVTYLSFVVGIIMFALYVLEKGIGAMNNDENDLIDQLNNPIPEEIFSIQKFEIDCKSDSILTELSEDVNSHFSIADKELVYFYKNQPYYNENKMYWSYVKSYISNFEIRITFYDKKDAKEKVSYLIEEYSTLNFAYDGMRDKLIVECPEIKFGLASRTREIYSIDNLDYSDVLIALIDKRKITEGGVDSAHCGTINFGSSYSGFSKLEISEMLISAVTPKWTRKIDIVPDSENNHIIFIKRYFDASNLNSL